MNDNSNTERQFVTRTTFAQVPEWVATHPDIVRHPNALVAYTHLALLGDYKTRVSTTGWQELCERTDWSKSTATRAIRVLREAGAIQSRDGAIWLPMDPPDWVRSDSGWVKSDPQVGSNLTSRLTLIESPEKDLAATAAGNGELFHVEPSKPVDPNHAEGLALAALAYEQIPRPVTRGGFNAVLCRIKAELRADTPPADIRAAILAGNITWTADGLRTAISRAKPRPSARPKRESVSSLLSKVRANEAKS